MPSPAIYATLFYSNHHNEEMLISLLILFQRSALWCNALMFTWLGLCFQAKHQSIVRRCNDNSGRSTIDRHFSAVTFFSRLGDFSQIADWYFRGWRAQTTRKFLFCSITSITCSKSRSWYFRGLDANRENRENMVTAEKWRFKYNVCCLRLHALGLFVKARLCVSCLIELHTT